MGETSMKANPKNTGNNEFPSYHTIDDGPGWEMFLSPGRQFIEKERARRAQVFSKKDRGSRDET